MAGYTRQSTADIVAGEVVRAAPINNEFNQLEVAFGAISGHTHDGSAGGGARVDGDDLTGVVPILHGGTGATTAATARTALGVAIGSAVQAWNAILDSISVLATNGFIARVSAGVIAARTMTGTANEITVTNGDGISGNPTFSLPTAMTMTGKTLTNGTYSGGTFSGTWSGALATASATITGGTITGITDLAIADGGTGASTAANARTNLGLGSMALQDAGAVNITGGSITGTTFGGTLSSSNVAITGGTITGITDLAIADGGTGASTAANARTNLGLLAIASTGDAADLTGTVASARISGSYTGITGTGALDAGSITSGFGTISTGDSIAGSNISASGTLTATGTVSGNTYTATGGIFTSGTANGVFSTASAGTVFLRPNGSGSASGEATVASTGRLTVAQDVVAIGNIYANNGASVFTTDGNAVGAVWLAWGAGDAFSSINARIEARGTAYYNAAVAQVLPTIAAQGAGSVGTFAFLYYGAIASPNTVAPGTNLAWSSHTGHIGGNVGVGSWRLMGQTTGAQTSLWLRYA